MQDFSRTGRWFAYHLLDTKTPVPEGVDAQHSIDGSWCTHRVTMEPENADAMLGNSDGCDTLGPGWHLFPETNDYPVAI